MFLKKYEILWFIKDGKRRERKKKSKDNKKSINIYKLKSQKITFIYLYTKFKIQNQ